MKIDIKSVAHLLLPSCIKERIRSSLYQNNKLKNHLSIAFHDARRSIGGNYEPLAISGKTYEAYREWEQRWSMIKTQLEEYQAKSVLDIGCAEGWFLRRAAEDLGCFALGIELSTRMLAPEIARLHDEVERLAIMKTEVNAKNLVDLPQCDVVLCLSVVHHIIREEGIEVAKAFVRAITEIAKKAIIFEMGTSEEYEMEWYEQLPAMPEGQVEFIKSFLVSCGLKNVREIGCTPSLKQEALRYLFVAEPNTLYK